MPLSFFSFVKSVVQMKNSAFTGGNVEIKSIKQLLHAYYITVTVIVVIHYLIFKNYLYKNMHTLNTLLLNTVNV